MKRNRVYKGLMGAFGACLLVAGCSSNQKPASLGASGGTAASGGTSAGGASSSGATSGSTTGSPSASGSTGANGGASGGASSGASNSAAPKPAAPTTITNIGGGSGGGGATIVVNLPADANGQAAIQAYLGFEDVSTKMDKSATIDPSLNDFADLNALSAVNAAVSQLRTYKAHYSGTFTDNPVNVVSVDMGAKPLPLVSITACADTTKWVPVDSSGKVLNHPPGARHLVKVQIHLSTDGKWRVTDVTPEMSKSC